MKTAGSMTEGSTAAEEMERRLEKPLLVAALLTIPALALEAAHGSALRNVAMGLNWAIWLTFLAEIVLMLRVVEHRATWLRKHPLEIAIIVLTPPFLPAGLQAARAFRLLRVLRLFKLASHLRRLLTTEGIRDIAVFALVTVLGGGAAYAAVENSPGHHLSTWDGVWWAITTVTTVGYGDFFPRTTAGRVIAIVVMSVGIGFVAVLTAAAASRFGHASEQAAAERRELRETLEEISSRLAALERSSTSRRNDVAPADQVVDGR